MQELDHGEWIPNLVRDLGGEQAERCERLVFAQDFLGLENSRVEPGIVQSDGGEAGERREQPLLRVGETVRPRRVDGQHAGRAVDQQRRGERGAEGRIAG